MDYSKHEEAVKEKFRHELKEDVHSVQHLSSLDDFRESDEFREYIKSIVREILKEELWR